MPIKKRPPEPQAKVASLTAPRLSLRAGRSAAGRNVRWREIKPRSLPIPTWYPLRYFSLWSCPVTSIFQGMLTKEKHEWQKAFISGYLRVNIKSTDGVHLVLPGNIALFPILSKNFIIFTGITLKYWTGADAGDFFHGIFISGPPEPQAKVASLTAPGYLYGAMPLRGFLLHRSRPVPAWSPLRYFSLWSCPVTYIFQCMLTKGKH